MKAILLLVVVIGVAVAQQHRCRDPMDCRRIGHLCMELHEEIACNNGVCQCVPHQNTTCKDKSDCDRVGHACDQLQEDVACNNGQCQCVPRL